MSPRAQRERFQNGGKVGIWRGKLFSSPLYGMLLAGVKVWTHFFGLWWTLVEMRADCDSSHWVNWCTHAWPQLICVQRGEMGIACMIWGSIQAILVLKPSTHFSLIFGHVHFIVRIPEHSLSLLFIYFLQEIHSFFLLNKTMLCCAREMFPCLWLEWSERPRCHEIWVFRL